MKRISIIVPVSSGGDVHRSVESVLDAAIDSLECIVVDSGHGDSVSETLPMGDNRLIVHRSPGSATARLMNAGLSVATGEVIGILSPDHFYAPGALTSVLRDFDRTPDCDSIYGQINLVDTDHRPIRVLQSRKPTLRSLRDRECLHSSAFFFRRRLVDKLGNFDESTSYWMFYDFWLRQALADIPFVGSNSILACKPIDRQGDKEKFVREMAANREAWELTLSKLGKCSSRWAIAYGRCAATQAGYSRIDSTSFDYATLQSAIADLVPHEETRFERWARIGKIMQKHSLSEASRILKKPKYALRFIPRGTGRRIRKQLGRRLFQLKYEDPQPCKLPKAYFSQACPNNPPTIAIVTPNLNQGAYIERTLRSVLDQQYPALEYVVQDGCSKDNSLEVIRQYESQLASWESVRDKGQSQAINLGLARTNAEIMAYLNSDDTLVPGSLAYVAKFFKDNPKVDVVYGNRLLIDEQDQVINYWVLPSHDRETLRWADYIPQETMFWRRRAWDAVGGCIDESFQFAMDWDLILRFQAAGMVFRHLPRFLGAFRITDTQKTSQLINTFGLNEMNRLRKRELGYCPTDREVSRKVKPYIRRQRYTEKRYELSEAISKMLSPYQEWKIEETSPISTKTVHRLVAA